MAHIVLCWELGGHLGHLSRLSALADGLHRQGHRVDFIAKELQHVKVAQACMKMAIFTYAAMVLTKSTPTTKSHDGYKKTRP